MSEVDVSVVLGGCVEIDGNFKFKTDRAAEAFLEQMQEAVIDFENAMRTSLRQVRDDEENGLYDE